MAQNGKFSKKQLARIYHPDYKVYLSKEAAAGWNTLRLVAKRYLKINIYPLGQDSAYRSYERQQYYWNLYQSGQGNLAAYPGTSNHGLGNAVDLASPIMRTVVDRLGKKYGWAKVEAPSEWWHVNYVGGYKRPNPGLSAKYPIARKGSGGKGQRWFVRKVIRRLRAHHFPVPASKGEFTGAVEKQVKAFQRSKKLKADGIVGKKTWKELRKKPIAAPQKPSKPPVNENTGNSTPKPEKPAKPPQLVKAEIIDVSNHQGDIDWQKVANDGIKGVYLKLSEGQDWKDNSTNSARIKAIKDAKLSYGFYHFLRPKKRDAALEARFFIKEAKKLGGWGDFLPVADIEVTELNSLETANYLYRFLQVLKKEGGVNKIVIYASPGWWDGNITQTDNLRELLTNCVAWVAHWGVKRPTHLKGIKGYALHQYTETGKVNGVNTNVDKNRSPDMNRLKR